jgi:rhodanese-related sulfurtransferase
MALQTITVEQAKQLVDDGAVLVDVREADEHARERVPGVRHMPLSKLDDAELATRDGKAVLFHCRSGARTAANAGRLAAKIGGTCDAFIVEGGLDAWKKAGLPVIADRSQPLELQRQVQIGAGSITLIGALLAVFISPWFLAVPLFVGAGLVFAGVTGFCGLARVLMLAPWNQTLQTRARAS